MENINKNMYERTISELTKFVACYYQLQSVYNSNQESRDDSTLVPPHPPPLIPLILSKQMCKDLLDIGETQKKLVSSVHTIFTASGN